MSPHAEQVNTASSHAMNGVGDHSHSAFATPHAFAEYEYDFIVAGGGTAGLVLAARLTENPNVSVGVIEAGKNKLDDMLVDTPGVFAQMLGNREYDWFFKTTPQATTIQDPVHHVVRGKMLGGSSGNNYLLYVRGSDTDYDDWAKVVGDSKWNAEEMKHYMRKHQQLEPTEEAMKDRRTMAFAGEHHGMSGPIRTSFNSWTLDVEDDVIQACDVAAGYTTKPLDAWSGDHIGFYHSLATIIRTGPHKGKRSYAARAYLEPILDRPNLHVITESLVTRINLVGDRAASVTYESDGKLHTAVVKREVLMAGGAVNNPQILELSGIGDPAVLSKAGVVCKVENKAVGENLQDHVGTPICYETDGVDTLDSMARPEVIQSAMQAYQERQTGPIGNTATVQGFFPYKLLAAPEEEAAVIQSIIEIKSQTEYAKRQREAVAAHLKDNKSANLQLMCVGATVNSTDGHVDQSRIFKPTVDPNGPNGITILAGLQYPVSRGSIHITSSDPHIQPAIDPAYLSQPADVDVLATGLKFAAKVCNSEPLKSKLGKRVWPDPGLDLNRIEDCRTAVKAFYTSVYHLCGTIAMGAAADSRLKVKGTQNIRVVDASAFPGQLSGNIISAVYMLAERAADIIKEDWSSSDIKV